MPREINRKTYYGTLESCIKIGICRAILFKWLKRGILEKTYRDRRGWRIFTKEGLQKIRVEESRLNMSLPNSERISTHI